MVDGWKVTAWIFIILFILENIFIYWGVQLVNEQENNEIKCSNEICYNIKAASFIYDETTKTCVCYDNNVVPIHQEVMV